MMRAHAPCRSRLGCAGGRLRREPAKAARSRELHSIEPDAADVPVSRGPRAGHAGLPAVPRRNARDGADARGDAPARRPADREAVRDPAATARSSRWRRRSAPDRHAAADGAERTAAAAGIAGARGVRAGLRAAHRQRARPRRRACRRLPARRPADPSGRARGHRALRPAARGVSDLRAQRPGAVPEVARVRRAGADRRGHGDDGAASSPRIRIRRTTTKCSSGAASTSSRAGSSARPKRPTRRSSASGPTPTYYELALYKLGWTLYKQEFYDEALHQFIALLDYKVSIGLRLRSGRTRKTTSGASPTRSASSA